MRPFSKSHQSLPPTIKKPDKKDHKIRKDEDNDLLGPERILHIKDAAVGPYLSLLVDGGDGASYVLENYVDLPLDPGVRDMIQTKIDARNRGASEPAFGVSPILGTVVTKADARRGAGQWR